MSWICCQLGAREHYAIPRALAAREALDRLITDAWVPGLARGQRSEDREQKTEVGGQRSEVGSQKSEVRGWRSAIEGRFDEELAQARVTAFNASLIKFELMARVRGLHGWDRTIARNEWFQRKTVAALSSSRLITNNSEPIIFAYSYAALEVFRYAKSRGWRTVLGQIDPGPVEERIVAEEAKREPEFGGHWRPAPAKYWSDWRRECDLADVIVVNSQWSREALIKTGVSGEKLSVIPLACDESDNGSPITHNYPTDFTHERPLRVLFLGQINLRKGTARLLQAMRALGHEPVELTMVGPIQLGGAQEASVGSRIRWVGSIPRQSTDAFYDEADMFILPTLSDGFALTQLEAMSHRLPIIASRRCGEVVKHGVNGLVMEEPSAAAIEEALRFCLTHPNELRRFSEAARVSDNFSTQRLGERLLSLAA